MSGITTSQRILNFSIGNAISIGGDSDTIGAITGSIAEAYYGVPEAIIDSVIKNLDSIQMRILYYFEGNYPSKAIVEDSIDDNPEDEEASAEDDTAANIEVSVFDILDMNVDKVIPEGAPITFSDDLGNGVFRARVDDKYLVPDFSSFDKKKKR